MSITFYYACGYSFDLMLCRKIDFRIEKQSWREQMLIQTLCKWHFYIDADYKKKFYACDYFVRLKVLICYANTCLQRNFNRFCLKVRVWVLFLIRAMFWETSKDVWQIKNLVFQFTHCAMMEFLDNVVNCSILLSFKTAFIEVEKTMFTVATLVLLFIINNPGPYTCSKKSKTFHAKCNLIVNYEKKCLC